jgi:hypothetical protein
MDEWMKESELEASYREDRWAAVSQAYARLQQASSAEPRPAFAAQVLPR